jgi:hypothetical protein
MRPSRLSRHTLLLVSLVVLVSSNIACHPQQSGNTDSQPDYYVAEGIRYFPAGPEFKLTRETATPRPASAEERSNAEPSDGAESR